MWIDNSVISKTERNGWMEQNGENQEPLTVSIWTYTKVDRDLIHGR